MTDTRAAALRQHFLDYFRKLGHEVVRSSPLVPQNDPTLMFTNAGMVQFKDVFVGKDPRPYKRAATSQKCMRVSGKHNDLEEVGRTPRHHTFFEMLGNFSFGDYFKADAIDYCWRFLTKDMGLDKDRLWVTVFAGEEGLPADDEARSIWKKVSGLPDERILALGMKDNFWSMGDTGPCGPCTEVHYDVVGKPTTKKDFDSGRVIEIWNNVFMQFERQKDGTLVPLPAPSVDTGMGLERLTMAAQGKRSNYETDLFMPLLEHIANLAKKPYGNSDGDDDVSMRVIADHARATSFLAADGVQPSNEGRGYVMRRIMRRAIRHGRRLGFDDLFFHSACNKVVEMMGQAYPELNESRVLIGKIAELEESSFRRTLDTGLKILGDEVAAVKKSGKKRIAGDVVFKLYDTFGFPKDLTEVIAREAQLEVDEQGFDTAMKAQRERSRAGQDSVGETAVADIYKALRQKVGAPEFIGYTHEDEPIEKRQGAWRWHDEGGVKYLEAQVTVKALLDHGREVTSGQNGVFEVVLDPTPFYGESGGQVGDKGVLVGEGMKAEVLDSQKPFEGLTVSRARVLAGTLSVGQKLWAGYIPAIRKEVRAHHSATHLLHGALRKILGEHVKQAGSLVDAEHLRFDYSHFESPTPEQMRRVEDDANRRVIAKHEVKTSVVPFEEGKKMGALAFFGDKYGDVVRVLSMGESIEFCGGTHAKNTGDIGMILVTRDEAVASGVRRIEAEVGAAARRTAKKLAEQLQRAAALLEGKADAKLNENDSILHAVAKAMRERQELEAALGKAAQSFSSKGRPPSVSAEPTVDEARNVRDVWQGLVQLANARGADSEKIAARLSKQDSGGLLAAFATLQGVNRENSKRVEVEKRQGLLQQGGDLMSKAKSVGSMKLLATEVPGADTKGLRELCDQLRDKLGSSVIALGVRDGVKASVVIGVSKDLIGKHKAGELLQKLAPLIDGKGGGKPDFAQGGGQNPDGMPKLFAELEKLVRA